MSAAGGRDARRRGRPSRPARAAALLVVAAAAGGPRARALVLAAPGRPIVLARQATAAERTAAEELRSYLERVTGGSFPIVEERPGAESEPAIFVGPTGFARAQAGPDGRPGGPEAWRVATVGDQLVLDGGRPRGTLYAVYHFLEDHVGVHWWTPWDEQVPRRARIELPALDRRGAPAFGYRDVYGIGGPREFCARNRMSGHQSRLDASHGGRDAYGPPSQVHNFYRYAPPERLFAAHPEFYSEIGGVRTAERAQLCLSSAALERFVAERLEGYIAAAEAAARASGEEPPRLFAFSPNDWYGACRCRQCWALRRRHGSDAASLVRFMNGLAGSIEARHPEVLLDTLAYLYTFDPPRGMTLHPQVVVRLSALQQRDFARPVGARRNRAYRRAIAGWRRVTRHLRIWDYTVTFGSEGQLPLPNLGIIAADLRYYLDHGIEGLFVQHDGAVLSDMRDLKLWVLLKLLEDPRLELEPLVREFTDGYYGAAGEPLRRYLAALEEAARHRPARLPYLARAASFRYLDPRLLRRAQALFDEAERSVAGDAERLQRVRLARVSLDRATLLRWSDGLLAASPDGPGLLPEQVAERYRMTAYVAIAERVPPPASDELRRRVDAEIAAFRSRFD